PLSELDRPRADRLLPGADLSLVLPRLLVPLPAVRGKRWHLQLERERRRRCVLRPRRRLPLRGDRRLGADVGGAGGRRKTGGARTRARPALGVRPLLPANGGGEDHQLPPLITDP